ncbi:hypothetical protein [Phytomonospora endophytica]|uniref:Uncharacterized protein n=1 Tax=Phytomonospora endophytica TaxID=714109 RepID=A0A841FQA3_9ACTN|nr:hypothetical protein [Phytomonospora endophytica]MBB6034739.1 hypothetical protein [Phytomonospora endophytica]GIG69057.1 hypothetical protein Pen01_53520 [Phytomonospora endophytica]
MRSRLVTPLLAAAAVLLSTVPATTGQAAPASPTTPAPSRSVTLPTGDRVNLYPNGAYGFEPAAGRDGIGYLSPKALDGSGDVSFIPADMVGEFGEGGLDPRRFNVSALLRAGVTDAATAPVADARAYDGLVPASANTLATKETRTVTVTFRDKSGAVPDNVNASVVSADGAVWDSVYLDDAAVATMELPPGEYGLAADILDAAEGDRKAVYVAALKTFTVGDAPVAITVNGAKSVPVTAKVERRSTLEARQLNLTWAYGGEEPGQLRTDASFGPDVAVYATPLADPRAGYAHSEIRNGPQGANGSYTYRLLFTEAGKVPARLVHEVDDDELAAVAVEYGGFGIPAAAARLCFNQGHADRREVPSCISETVDLPYRGTELVVADPDLYNLPSIELRDRETWQTMGYDGPPRSFAAPGDYEWSVGTGPLTYGIRPYATEDPDDDKGASGMYRVDDLLYFGFDQLGDGPAGEDYWLYGGDMDDSPLNNVAVITRDGAEINRITGDVTWFDTGLPPGEAGRYRLVIDGHLDVPWSNLLTGYRLDWTFDTAPSGVPEKSTPLPFSLVVFGADGVHGGVADRETPQRVTLDYTSQSGGTEATASTLAFEVSYDEGATWTSVALDRDGDHATATLHHPAGAGFVSVRTTATDDLGSSITQTTVRSYALV